MTMHICFSHGKESGPWGSKIRAMASLAERAGHSVHSVDYQGIDDPVARVQKLKAYLAGRDGPEPVVLVGSSYGGYVCACAAPDVAPSGMFLLAPAICLPGFPAPEPTDITCPVEIVHGFGDAVVPLADSLDFAAKGGMTLHAIAGDHRLIDALPLVLDLFACALSRFAQ